MTETPTISFAAMNVDDAALYAPTGFMRMVLDGALKDANLWTRATGASQETKNHWSRRAAAIKALLEQLPPPVNPRDPFDDIPGEPTPEEAEARWRERAAADDARESARRVKESKNPDAERDAIRDELGLPTLSEIEKASDPDLEWSTELEVVAAVGMLEPPEDYVAAGLTEDGLIPGDKPARPAAPPADDLDDLLG